jgi:hypothetical protein
MLTYNLTISGLIALTALSMMTTRANANLAPSARDEAIRAQTTASERAAARDGDRSWLRESIQLRRELCKLGNQPRRLSEQDIDLCILKSL